MSTHAYRAALLHCLSEPQQDQGAKACAYHADGILVVEQGRIAFAGDALALPARYQGIDTLEYPDALIVPGFVDTHIHYPQSEMIASHGQHLLAWLETYTFPTERRFQDPTHAAQTAEFFLDELLRNGTTTALVCGTVHPQSVEAFFSAALKRNLRMLAGKVLMDRNAPDYLTDSAESGYRDSLALAERWHDRGRLSYAVTPRFAPTSSAEQLTRAGQLFQEMPGLYLHTHLAENPAEVQWVKALFPERAGYLDVYDHYRLTGPRALFAHGIHLSEDEFQRLGDSGSSIAFCPTSNLFLGSGLFNLAKAEQAGIRVGLGTDVGAGTSFSQLRTLDEAYKVLQLQGQTLDPFKALYLATLGGARALHLDPVIGNFETGKEADFLILDLQATPLLKYRLSFARTLAERLFALITLGDDRLIKATYAAGQAVHLRDAPQPA